MANPNTGVFPVYENQFKIGTDKENLNTIANMTSFSVSFDNGVEEWNPFDQGGWKARLMTAKSITISVTGQRTVGDTGNDFVASLAFLNGRNVEATFVWVFPDGTEVSFENAIINVKVCGSGESTKTAPLEFDVLSNGKPTVTLPTTTTTEEE